MKIFVKTREMSREKIKVKRFISTNIHNARYESYIYMNGGDWVLVEKKVIMPIWKTKDDIEILKNQFGKLVYHSIYDPYT